VEGLRCSTHKRLRCSSIGFAEVKKLAGTRKSRTSSRILATLGGILRPPASCQPKVSTTLGAFIELAPTGSEVVYGGILSWKARVCLTVAISESSFIGQREGNSKPDATQQPSSFLSPVSMVRQILQGLPFLGPETRGFFARAFAGVKP
jgi:hypothetical protein